MSVRMRDIANQLGISISTVSLALRAAPQVAEETRVRVMDTAEQLGYSMRPRPARPTFSHVAFVTRENPSNDFYSAVLSGAESECRRLGLSLHFVQIDANTMPRTNGFIQADGLLIVGSIAVEIVQQFKQFELPIVLVDNNLPFLQLDRILIENTYSIARMTQRAFDYNHRSIAFLCGPQAIPSFKERLVGYRTAMHDLGLPPTELFFQYSDGRDVAQTLHTWLEQHGTFGFTALIGCNDKAMLRAFHTLHDYGVQVPHDISLLGFDDVELASAIRPTLTTTRVPRELLGRLGVQRLFERARDPSLSTVGITVETTMIERESLRALPVDAVGVL